MAYEVRVLEDVFDEDLANLIDVDPLLVDVINGILRELESDPWLGTEMRKRNRLEILADCRKIPFDVSGRRGKPRFRLVYRNDPDDGSIAVVTVLAAGARSDLDAYRKAATRLGSERRRERGRPRRGVN